MLVLNVRAEGIKGRCVIAQKAGYQGIIQDSLILVIQILGINVTQDRFTV